MPTTTLSVTQKLRIILGLTTLAMLIAIASLSSGCNTGSNNNPGPTERVTNPTASPSPSPSVSPFKLPPGDTIIVIKDGSAHITFDSQYEDVDPETFTSQKVVLDSIEVSPALPSATPYAFSDPKHEVTINTGGDDKDIVITGKQDKVELKFKRDVYKQNGCTGSVDYCDPNRHVWLIRIDKQPWRACNPVDKCVVTVHTHKAS